MRQLEATTHTVLDRLCSAAVGPIGVGVSGGSDSVALLVLAARWAVQRGRTLLVLTFDHGLRPAAAEEAASVAALCHALGVGHQTLQWSQPAPRQSDARIARHGALASALRTAGGTHLLLGHTQDDQRETFLMRARQGSTWWGLAGMQALSPSPVWPEGRSIVIARPVLDMPRDTLRSFLRSNDMIWHDDPSNQNPAYERVRMRALLAQMPKAVLQIDQTMIGLGVLRRAASQRLSDALGTCVTCHEDGLVSCAPGALQGSTESAARLLSPLIQCAAGHAQMPGKAGVEALVRAIQDDDLQSARTLGGAWIAMRKGQLVVARDPGLAAEADWTDTVWDGRFERLKSGPSCVPDPGQAHPMARAGLPPPQIPARCLIGDRIAAIGTILA